MSNLGHAYLQLGNARQAIEYYQHALTISGEFGDVLMAAAINTNLAQYLAQAGRAREALPLIEQAVRDFRKAGCQHDAKQAEWVLTQIRSAIR